MKFLIFNVEEFVDEVTYFIIININISNSCNKTVTYILLTILL